MAWTSPMTAVANDIFTAAQFNTNVRDNLNETAPAKATVEGSYFTVSGTNSITQRTPQTAYVDTNEVASPSGYGNLATVGPAVTVTTGTTALVLIHAGMTPATANACRFSFEVSGATTIAASNQWSVRYTGVGGSGSNWGSVNGGTHHFVTGLTPGSNTFTMKYDSAGSSCAWYQRRITVIPF